METGQFTKNRYMCPTVLERGKSIVKRLKTSDGSTAQSSHAEKVEEKKKMHERGVYIIF